MQAEDSADLASGAAAPKAPAWPRTARRLTASRGLEWWAEGWRIFTAAPVPWLVIALVLVLVFGGLAAATGGIVGALLTVLWPIVAGGLYLGCHAMARGQPLGFDSIVAGFRDGRAGPLALLGLVALAAGLTVSLAIALLLLGTASVGGLMGLTTGDPSAALAASIAGMGVAALLVLPILVVAGALLTLAWWFAVPLVALNRAGPIEALSASFGAAWRNLGAVVVFALIYILLAIVATMPFGLGWFVLAPVAIGGNYASWREVFGD